MNWIFPIAGFGTRTSKLGEYKPLIENWNLIEIDSTPNGQALTLK